MTQEVDLWPIVRNALKPPSRESAADWCERNITLDRTSAMPGRYSLGLMPFIRAVYDAAQSPDTRTLVMMVSAQSSKTTIGMNLLARCIDQDPATAMWVGASAEHCEGFFQRRMLPHLHGCEVVKSKMLSEGLVKDTLPFETMNVILRGSNSRIGLQSDPVRWFFCDERREWKKGSISLLRKRRRTFANYVEISMGTAGVRDDELDADFKNGSQTFIHWNCPHCGFSQPFRFGKKATTLFPTERLRGGLIWETSETTKPGGEWNWKALRATVRYECEGCGHHFKNSEKQKLLKTWHLFHRNPEALPSSWSLHWNALYMPWQDCDWENTVEEYLRALISAQRGDIEPMKAFVTETLGEPWEEKGEKAESAEILKRCGDFLLGQTWPETREAKSCFVLTIDVQSGYLVYVVRQWIKIFATGKTSSRLVEAGKLFGFEEARELQEKYKIQPSAVWVDSGYDTKRVYSVCAKYGWIATKGEEREYFISEDEETGRRVRRPWHISEVDANIGEGPERLIPLILWSNPTYKEKLYLYVIRGVSQFDGVEPQDWQIPKNTPPHYLQEIQGEQRQKKEDAKGAITYFWKKIGPNHSGDCELLQQVLMDQAGAL